MSSNNLENILSKLASVKYRGAGITEVETEISHDEAKKQIKSLFLEIVGEDEWDGKSDMETLEDGSGYRDDLRAKLRARINTL